jgi:hypothetical protein
MKRLLALLRLKKEKPNLPKPKKTVALKTPKSAKVKLELFKDDGDLGYC